MAAAPLRRASLTQRARRGSLVLTKAEQSASALCEAFVIPNNVPPPAKEYVRVLWQTTPVTTLPSELVHERFREPGQSIVVAGPASVILPVSASAAATHPTEQMASRGWKGDAS